MSILKKIATMFLTVLMIVSSMTVNTMAAEQGEDVPDFDATELVSVEYNADGTRTEVYEFDVMQVSTANGDYGIMPLSVDQTFNMGSSHRGGDRTYAGNKLQFSVKITDANGNAVDNFVSVQLHDYNHSYALVNSSVKADGRMKTESDISITPGRTYYFYYQVLSGASRTLKVRMIIRDYNG